MSEVHQFYENSIGIGSEVLWEIWCSSEPVLLDDVIEVANVDMTVVLRDLMYFVNCSVLYPVRVDESIGFVYNPVFEWVSGVCELVRKHSKDELELMLRESEAGVEMYQELYGVESVDELAESESGVSDIASWVVDEIKAEWIVDALEFYELFDRLLAEVQYTIVSGGVVEKAIVEYWTENRDD